MRELGVPAEVSGEPDAFEYLRVWNTPKGDQASMLVEIGDAEVWGIALADLGRHIARRLAESNGGSKEAHFDALIAAFQIELNAQSPRV